MKWLTALLIFSLLADISLSAVDYNELVDRVLDGIKEKLSEESKDTVNLPDYHKVFTKNVLFFPVHGNIEASGITLGNFSTMRRFRSVDSNSVYKNDKTGKLNIMSVFSLDELLLTIDDFKYNFALFHIDTPVNIKVESNRFAIMLEMYLNQTTKQCDTSLGFAMVDHLGDFQVILGDSGFFSPSIERVDDIVLDWLVPDISNAINDHIKPAAVKVVEEFSQDICSGFF